MRAVRECASCHTENEIAADDLCFRCYRRVKRAEERERDGLWAKSTGSVAKAQRTTRKALMKIMDATEELENAHIVSAQTINTIRQALEPEVARISLSLIINGSEREHHGESEQFTKAELNSEHGGVSELFTDDADIPEAPAPLPHALPQKIWRFKETDRATTSN